MAGTRTSRRTRSMPIKGTEWQTGSFRLGPGIPRASFFGPDAHSSCNGLHTAGRCPRGRSHVSQGLPVQSRCRAGPLCALGSPRPTLTVKELPPPPHPPPAAHASQSTHEIRSGVSRPVPRVLYSVCDFTRSPNLSLSQELLSSWASSDLHLNFQTDMVL